MKTMEKTTIMVRVTGDGEREMKTMEKTTIMVRVTGDGDEEGRSSWRNDGGMIG
jgi:hypothetical protein